MRAVVLGPDNGISVADVPDPRPAGRALVRVARAGLCGTDLKIAGGLIPANRPVVGGHEMIGTVVEPGAPGTVPAGTRVLVDPGVVCGRCVLCLRDLGHLCREGALMGRDVDGCFAELVAVDERQLHPLPDAIDADEAALLQVLATCVHAQTMVSAFPGQTAVVLGLGVAGMLHVQLLRARGIGTVIGVTRSAAKLALAAELGATAVATPAEAAAVVADATGGNGPDLVVESAGTSETLTQAIELAGFGGTILAYGIVASAERLPTYQLYFRELTLVAPRAARPRDYRRGVELAAIPALRLAPLLTASFPLDEARAAFAACTEPSQLKVALDVTSP